MRAILITSCFIFLLKGMVSGQSLFIEPDPESVNTTEIEDDALPNWILYCFEPELHMPIMKYLSDHGPIADWEELFRIKGVTIDHIICLYEERGSVTSTGFNPSSKKLLFRLRHDIRPLDKNGGYGIDQYGRIHYKNSYKDEVFFQWEHDRGEWNKEHTRFPDYISGYFQKRFTNKKWELLLGDFNLSWGQGLLAYSGLFASPGAGIQHLIRVNNGYFGNRSKIETGFYRGIALKFQPGAKGRDKGLIWYSRSSINTSLKQEGRDEQYWQSVDRSGDHSTASSKLKRKAVQWQSTGTMYTFENNRLNMCLALRRDRFSHDYYPGDVSYRSGLPIYGEIYSGSISYDANMDHITLWGEYALQNTLGYAFLQGLSMPLSPEWKAGIITRYANRRFHAVFGSPFFKRSPPHNEWGIYYTIEGNPAKGILIRAYWNYWNFPGVRYLFDNPSSGMRCAISLTKRKRKHYQVSLQLIWDSDRFKRNITTVNALEPFTQRIRCRMHFDKNIASHSNLKLRMEFAGNPLNWLRSNSRLIYVNYVFKPMQSPWKIATRITWSDIDNYDHRIAAFESDVLGRFRINSYFRKEVHTSISLRYKFRFGLTIDLYSRYIFQDKTQENLLPWSHTIQLQYRLI